MNRRINKKYLLMGASFFLLIPFVAKSKMYEGVSKSLFDDVIYEDNSELYADMEPKVDMTSFANVSSSSKKSNKIEKETNEVYFSADEMESNSSDNTITAVGNVNIVRDDVSIQADKIVYNREKDIVEAIGNVVLLSPDGSVVYADRVNLKDKMNDVSMDNIKVVMQDQSVIAARSVIKYSDDNKKMKNVVYSPCDLCVDSDPLWQIKAQTVRHNAEKKDIEYSNAFLEIKGIPVMYAPYFSHPDPTVKRRSGFLMPGFSNSNYLGANFNVEYFWNISDHENVVFSPSYSSKVGPVMAADYEKYLYDGRIKFNGSYLNDSDRSRVENDDRGHIFSKMRYDINDMWVANFDLNYVSDRSYFRDMSMSKKDDAWLNSNVSFQRFDNRNYTNIEAYNYKQISYALKKEDKPYIVPLIQHEQVGETNEYGFYNKNEYSLASIYRRENDSSYRMSMINSFVLPDTTTYGAKQKLTASVKTDLYYIDNYQNRNNENYDGGVARIHPQLSYEWRLPFVRATDRSRQVIEPIVVGVLSPNGGNKLDKISNNDSRGSRLDDTNILEVNRYAGYDVNDTGTRVSYGLNWSYYNDVIGRSSMLIAQSYKTRRGDYFTNNGTDESYLSDYFGHMYVNPHKYLDLNYRFTLDRRNFELEYSELSTTFGPKILNAYVAYIYLKDNNMDIVSQSNQGERKEIYISLNSALTRDWSVSVYNRKDLTKGGNTLEVGGALIYEDDCFMTKTSISKDNSNDPDYKGNFEFKVDFFFKTLGGVGSK